MSFMSNLLRWDKVVARQRDVVHKRDDLEGVLPFPALDHETKWHPNAIDHVVVIDGGPDPGRTVVAGSISVGFCRDEETAPRVKKPDFSSAKCGREFDHVLNLPGDSAISEQRALWEELGEP